MSKNLAIAGVFCAAALGLFGCGGSPKETVTLETISATSVKNTDSNGSARESFTGAVRALGKDKNGNDWVCLVAALYNASEKEVAAAQESAGKSVPVTVDAQFCRQPFGGDQNGNRSLVLK